MIRVALLILALLVLPCAATAAPVILYTDITSGPNTGGEDNNGCYLSIFGFNFGSDINNITVTIGGGEVARYMHLGTSYGRPDVQWLAVQLGSAAQTGSVKVTVAGVDSNTDHTFTVRSGNFYFVSTSGDDNTGVVNDISHPYRTANHVGGLAAFDAGDFMVVRGGTYDLSSGNENVTMNNRWYVVGRGEGVTVRNGTAASPITIYGYPGETTTIDWGSTVGGTAYTGIKTVDPTEHFTFANISFNVRDTGGVPIYLGFYNVTDNYCNYPRIVNIRVQGGMYGLQGVNQVVLMRTDGINMYGLGIGNQSALASPTLQSHMIYLSYRYTDGDIGWCYIHDNPYGRAAFQVAGDRWGSAPYAQGTAYTQTGTWSQNTNVRIHDNLFQNLPKEAILFGLGAFEIYFYNNIINNANTTDEGGFSPVAIRGTGESPNACGINCGVYYLYNNTIYTDAQDYNPGGIIQFAYSPGGLMPEQAVLKNNIINAISSATNYYQINHASFSESRIVSDYNIWYGSSNSIPSFAGANDSVADPKFSNVGSSDFSLQSDSPAKNSGSNVVSGYVSSDYIAISRPQGAAFDIGAYEYNEGTSTGLPFIGSGGTLTLGVGGTIYLQ